MPPLPWGEGWGEGVRSLDRSHPLTRRGACARTAQKRRSERADPRIKPEGSLSPNGRGKVDPANELRFHRALPAQNDSDETTLTFWAGSSFCTPSATTLAPSSMPPLMTTQLVS